MSLRVYSGPTEEFAPGHYRAVASQYMTGFVNFFPSAANGLPASPWVLTIGRATDWTLANADARIKNIFASELDGTENTKAELIASLEAKTLGSVGVTRANAIKAALDLLGVPYADFDGTTTMWRLFRRVLGNLIERDAAWGTGWTI